MTAERTPAPKEIGRRYRVEHELGRGGYGRVFLVTDNETLGRYALKFLDRLPASRAARFRGEAFAANRVADQSPHVARVHAAQFDGDTGVPFLAMDLLKGRTLDRLVRPSPEGAAAPLSPAQALAVLRDVAHALAAAHALEPRIIHCDIKPENVMVEGDARSAGSSLRAYVLDFGIARLSDEYGAHDSTAVGSVRWMAPERFDNKATPATDVYSFALVAFYALTGELVPHEGRGQAGAVARAAARGVSLPSGFDRWFLEATRAAPHERTASVRVAYEQLAAIFHPRAPLAPTVGARPSPLALEPDRPSPAPPEPPAPPAHPASSPTILASPTDPPSSPVSSQTRVAPRSRTPSAARASIAALGVAAMICGLVWGFVARPSSDSVAPPAPTRPSPAPQVLTPPIPTRGSDDARQEIDALLVRWSTTAWTTDVTASALAAFYIAEPMVRPIAERSSGLDRVSEGMRRLRAEGGGIGFDVRRARMEDEPYGPTIASARQACGAGPLVLVRLTARTARYRCSSRGPFPPVEGEYLLRVRGLSSGAPRICYEAWSNETDARACAGAGPR
jgi:serine/threonine protein kinase